MELLTSNRRDTAVAVTPDDPRCVAIINRYGSADNLYMNVASIEPKAGTPTLVMCLKAYGTDIISRQIASRMKMCAMTMGETSMDDIDASLVASAIIEDASARVLGYDLVLRFFRRLELGHFELFACKPRNIMSAWQQYAKQAINKQARLNEEAEREQREAERARHEKEYLRPEEFRRWKEQQSQRHAKSG